MALHGKATLRKLQHGIDTRTPFNAGNVRGQVGAGETGRMPDDAAAEYRRHAQSGVVVYTVYSYATPIAYLLMGGVWIEPPVKYSPTTTNHQHAVAVAISNHGFYPVGV